MQASTSNAFAHYFNILGGKRIQLRETNQPW